MEGFSFITFKENVAIALEVTRLCGMPREQVLKGMYTADPDPGVLKVDTCEHRGRLFKAVNLFAANDPESTVMNYRLLRERGKLDERVALVINCRHPRRPIAGGVRPVLPVATRPAPEPPAAPVWAWRSWPPSSGRTTVRSRSTATRAAPPSLFAYRSRLRPANLRPVTFWPAVSNRRRLGLPNAVLSASEDPVRNATTLITLMTAPRLP
jgi:hypothetical protein